MERFQKVEDQIAQTDSFVTGPEFSIAEAPPAPKGALGSTLIRGRFMQIL